MTGRHDGQPASEKATEKQQTTPTSLGASGCGNGQILILIASRFRPADSARPPTPQHAACQQQYGLG